MPNKNGQTLYEATSYFTPFPDPKDVFSSDVENHRKYLVPLASLELSHINPEWNGLIHFVAPLCLTEDVPGSEKTEYHTYLCQENWLGYKLTNGKMQFLTNWNYFDNETEVGRADAINAGIQATADNFKKTGFLFHNNALVENLGGYAYDNNWANFNEFPILRHGEWTDEDGSTSEIVSPLTEDGRPFEFIGRIFAGCYCKGEGLASYAMSYDLQVFYDPKDEVVLTTLDWS